MFGLIFEQYLRFCVFLPLRGKQESCTAQRASKKPDLVSKAMIVYLKELVAEVVAEVI